MNRLILVSAGDGRELIPAIAIGAPDMMGFVPLKEPVTIDGQDTQAVPVESCHAFNEDLLLHYNGLINGGRAALDSAVKMLDAYGHPAFEPPDEVPLKH